MRYYEGSEPCPGCGTPGTERSRGSKNEVCRQCKELINLGKELKKDFRPEDYVYLFTTLYKLQFFNGDHFGDEIEAGFYELLDALNRNNIQHKGHFYLTQGEGTTASKRVIIRKEYAEALKKIVDALQKQQALYHDKIRGIEKERQNILSKERNKIYNEGIKEGKRILVGLNNGTIAMSDFEQEKNKY